MKLTSCAGLHLSPHAWATRTAVYLLAIALTVLTLAIRLDLFPRGHGPLLILFMLPIAISAFLGGIGPGLTATALSTLIAYFYLFSPINAWHQPFPGDLAYLLIFALVGIWISLLSESSLSVMRHRRQTQEQFTSLRHLIDSTDDSVVATSLDGVITHWNRGAEKIYGFSTQEALGQPISILFPSHLLSAEQSIMDQVRHGEHVPAYETQRQRKDGSLFDITTTVSAIHDSRQRLIGISRISSDISHYKHIEQAKTAAEDKFRALVEQSLTGVYILQEDKIVYANQAMADIFAYDKIEDLIGKQCTELVAPEDRVLVVSNILRRLHHQDETLRYRFNGLRRDGQRIVVEVHGRRCMHNGHEAIIGALMDETEAQHSQDEMARQVAEKTAQLRLREQELDTILDNMPAMISYYDPDLHHRYGNQSYCDWHGVPSSKLPGLPLSAILDPKVYAEVLPQFDLVEQGQSLTFERELTSADGQRVWQAQIHLAPNMHHGVLSGLFCLIQDLTPIRSAERALRESEARFRQLFESAPVGMGLYRQDGACVMANQALADLVGASRELLQAQNFRQLTSWRDSGMLQLAEKALASKQAQHCETQLDSSFGRHSELQCEFTLPEIQGEHFLLLLAKDITPFRQAERLMQQAIEAELDKSALNRQYRQVVENLMDGFHAVDMEGRILDANDVFAEQTGYSREELLSMRISEIQAVESPAEVAAHLAHIATAGSDRFETWLRRKDGSAWPGDISASYSPTEGKIYSFARDMTKMKHAEEEIRRLAFFDSLTQLPNRQLLLDRLRQALLNSRRSRLHGALLFIDLDNFKQLNDTQGHDMGDRLLVMVAERLKNCVRAQDTVSRLGGDEFVVMLEDLHADAAEASKQILVVANTILKTLNQPYALDNIDYHNTPSIGITLFNDHETTIEEQLKHADLAMYQAKASGRNTLCFFDPVSQSAVEDRSELETALRLALRDDLLELHYQAQIDRSGNLVGAEALVSWEHPERGTLGAQALRTLTDATGLGHPLGLKTLELACAQLASWAQDPQLANTSMAVHVSANLFGHHDFVPHLRAQLTRHKVHPALLKLELPESLLLSDPVKFSSKMTELSNLGVTFSLHNFGTGYATLAHLEILPLVQLKIAPDFVRDLLTDQNDAAMVRAIIAMGHSLGLEVVAEGVDTEAQWTCLMREGCDVGQGAWFSQPVPSGTFRKTHGAIR